MISRRRKIGQGLVTTAPFWIIFGVIGVLMMSNMLMDLPGCEKSGRACDFMGDYNLNVILLLLLSFWVLPAVYAWNWLLMTLGVFDNQTDSLK